MPWAVELCEASASGRPATFVSSRVAGQRHPDRRPPSCLLLAHREYGPAPPPQDYSWAYLTPCGSGTVPTRKLVRVGQSEERELRLARGRFVGARRFGA